jgi:hypothetical protein
MLESAEAGHNRQRPGRRPGGTAAVLGEAAAASGKPPDVRRGLRSDRVDARALGGEQNDVVGFGRLSPTAPDKIGGACRQQQRPAKAARKINDRRLSATSPRLTLFFPCLSKALCASPSKPKIIWWQRLVGNLKKRQLL